MLKHSSNILLNACRNTSNSLYSCAIRCLNSRNASTTVVDHIGLSSDNEGKQVENNKDNDDLVQINYYDSITIIGLNRSHKRNAINKEMASQICNAITNFENDNTSTVGVLHGIGGTFSSGCDIDDLQSDTLQLEDLENSEGAVGPTRRIIKKPMVCSISGFCIANGLELALMCDLRVIEEDAVLGFLNRRFGIPSLDGGNVRLPALIGLSRALDLILTGKKITAKEAFEMGLASRIVATGTSLGQSINLAQSIAKFPQAALNHDRISMYTSAMKSFETSCKNEIMSLSKEVVSEMKNGAAHFKNGFGRGGKSTNLKSRILADWEVEECRREVETEKIRNENKPKDC